MRAVDIIIKKRDQGELTREEIGFFINGFTSADFLWRPRTSTAPSAALPLPVEAETCSMPADYRLGLDQQEGLAPFGPESRENNPQNPIRGPEPESSSTASLQNGEPVAESQDLDLERGSCS